MSKTASTRCHTGFSRRLPVGGGLYYWGYEIGRVTKYQSKLRANTIISTYKADYKYPPMLRSLTCGMYGAVVTTPQSHDPKMLLLGILKRNCTNVGSLDKNLLSELKEFITNEISSWPKCEILDPEVWLKECKLPAYKKIEMKKEFDREYPSMEEYLHQFKHGTHNKLRDATVFGKAEYLIGEKTLRAINPTSAAYKYMVGPYFHWMEETIMKGELKKFFIKGVPVPARPDHILTQLGEKHNTSHTYSTDYSSFECSFVSDVMEHCEMVIYEHCFGQLPVWDIIHALTGLKTKNNEHASIIKNKYFTVETTSLRMSGEMNTSLGNGLSNYFITKFLISKIKGTDLRGVFEGDDGLFRYEGKEFPQDLAEKLGFSLKIQECEANTASFCGNIFDLETKTVISDPWYCLAGSGYSFSAVGASVKTLDVLTASRGLSMMYQFPNCPVIPTFGMRMFRTACLNLRLSEKQTIEKIRDYYLKSQRVDWWERQKMLAATEQMPDIKVSDSTRNLFEQVYQFPIELQLYVERKLSESTGWFYCRDLLEHMSKVDIQQLDGSTVNYREWVLNFGELENHTTTPLRTGSLTGLSHTRVTSTEALVLPQQQRQITYFDAPFEVEMW